MAPTGGSNRLNAIATIAIAVYEWVGLAILRRAEQLLMEEVPIIPMYYYVSKSMVKPYVRGYFSNLLWM